MADPSLNQPVIVRAVSLNASSIPAGYSPAYSQYILSQAIDFTNVVGKANEAGQGAYDAQVKNDEQDVTLADHEGRITANTNAINLLEVRLTTAEGKIVVLRSDVDYLLNEVIDIRADIVTLQNDVTAIQDDYVSKAETANQTIQPVSGSRLSGPSLRQRQISCRWLAAKTFLYRTKFLVCKLSVLDRLDGRRLQEQLFSVRLTRTSHLQSAIHRRRQKCRPLQTHSLRRDKELKRWRMLLELMG